MFLIESGAFDCIKPLSFQNSQNSQSSRSPRRDSEEKSDALYALFLLRLKRKIDGVDKAPLKWRS